MILPHVNAARDWGLYAAKDYESHKNSLQLETATQPITWRQLFLIFGTRA
jgi:hypothetical protein